MTVYIHGPLIAGVSYIHGLLTLAVYIHGLLIVTVYIHGPLIADTACADGLLIAGGVYIHGLQGPAVSTRARTAWLPAA